MKKILAFVFVLCFAASAFAAKVDGLFYTAETPDGWTAQIISQDENSVSSMLKAPDDSMAFVVSVLQARKDLTMEGDGEAYEYTAVIDGSKAYAQVFNVDEETIGNITIIGDHESELATAIFNSIEFKEPK